MLQQDTPSDFVIATGIGATVREFAEHAFQYVGLDYRHYVVVDDRYNRPNEVDALIGDASKASKFLNWKAQTTWRSLAEIMVDSDMVDVKK
jgi:GDPmannose 4,6-dehydratase